MMSGANRQAGSGMLRVLIKCPVTGEAIATDFEADPQSWEHRQLGLNFAWCGACKITHAWTKADAWLEEKRR